MIRFLWKLNHIGAKNVCWMNGESKNLCTIQVIVEFIFLTWTLQRAYPQRWQSYEAAHHCKNNRWMRFLKNGVTQQLRVHCPPQCQCQNRHLFHIWVRKMSSQTYRANQQIWPLDQPPKHTQKKYQTLMTKVWIF